MTLYSDYEGTGSIQTGNELVNQLISNVEWGMKDNFLDVPTDCPQRDERMGWTGDTQVFSGTACYLADTYAFYRKYLYDLYKEQADCRRDGSGGGADLRSVEMFLCMGRCGLYRSVECLSVQRGCCHIGTAV